VEITHILALRQIGDQSQPAQLVRRPMENQLATGRSQGRSQEAAQVPEAVLHSVEPQQRNRVLPAAAEVVEVQVRLEPSVKVDPETSHESRRGQSVKNLNSDRPRPLAAQLFQEETAKP
jgi:hypothetical protein